MKAYLYVIKRALADGHRVAVWSCEGGCWETKFIRQRSGAFNELKAAVESQDWTNIVVKSVDSEGRSVDKIATFAVMLDYGQAPGETICDWVVSDYADQVMADYESGAA